MVFQAYYSENNNASQAYHTFKALVGVLHNSNKKLDQLASKVAALKKEAKKQKDAKIDIENVFTYVKDQLANLCSAFPSLAVPAPLPAAVLTAFLSLAAAPGLLPSAALTIPLYSALLQVALLLSVSIPVAALLAFFTPFFASSTLSKSAEPLFSKHS